MNSDARGKIDVTSAVGRKKHEKLLSISVDCGGFSETREMQFLRV